MNIREATKKAETLSKNNPSRGYFIYNEPEWFEQKRFDEYGVINEHDYNAGIWGVNENSLCSYWHSGKMIENYNSLYVDI